MVLSGKKELDFFSYHYENGYEWYEQQFSNKPGAKAVGEISPSYFNEASVPERAKLYSPSLRILLSLRDPVERALSQHRHLIRIGTVSRVNYRFEKALANNPSYIEQGLYATHLSRWLESFPESQILVVLMDDIKKHPDETARNVYRFLGISEAHQSAALYEKSNPSYVVRSRSLDSVVCTLRGVATKLGVDSAWRGLGRLGLQRLYRRMNRQPSNANIPSPPPETLTLLKQRFKENTLELQRMLGRDLDKWL